MNGLILNVFTAGGVPAAETTADVQQAAEVTTQEAGPQPAEVKDQVTTAVAAGDAQTSAAGLADNAETSQAAAAGIAADDAQTTEGVYHCESLVLKCVH